MEVTANGRGTAAYRGKGSERGASSSASPHRPYRPWREQLRTDPVGFYTCQAHRAYRRGRSQQDVGKTVKASKRVFVWRFSFGPRGEHDCGGH